MKTWHLAVHPRIEDQIPGVLLDYLCKLVQKEDSVAEIVLTSGVLGMGEIQEISCNTPSGTLSRRVFGFMPVDARLQVSVRENQIEMAIAG